MISYDKLMSDLADAVFEGQLLGHVIGGEQLTTSVIADAVMTADLASNLVVEDKLSTAEHQIIQAKVSQAVVFDGQYDPSQIIDDHFNAQLFVNDADSFLS